MPHITHFHLSHPAATELSPLTPAQQTVLQRTPKQLSWHFGERDYALTHPNGLAAARIGANKIAIVEVPFDTRQNQAYLINGCGQRLHDWKRNWRILWCTMWRRQTAKSPCSPIA